MKRIASDWILFIILSLIWGSSFILIKIGLQHLNAYEVATIRILSAGIVLLPFAPKAFKKIPTNKLLTVLLAGICGTFAPAYLYCIAETKIDSSLAAILNALTPLFAIIMGVSFFRLKVTAQKIIGVLIGFAGLCLLPFAANGSISFENFSFSFLVIIATIFYGINANIVSRHLKEIGSLNIASAAFAFCIIPSLIVLHFTGFYSKISLQKEMLQSLGSAVLLGVLGTAVATVLFYKLVKSTGAIFSSLVTYGIPFVAILWGILAGEKITFAEIIALFIILAGVYIVNK